MKKIGFLLAATIIAQAALSQVNLQVFYDFGSEWMSSLPNQRSNRVTTTIEGLHFDNWGNTYYFVDLDYAINQKDPKNAIFGGYMEIARCLNFWKESKVKDLSIQIEYNGGLGLFKNTDGSFGGYKVGHAFLAGLDYFLHTQDFNNTFNLKLLYRYDTNFPKTVVPVQFTFVWGCKDLGNVKGLSTNGYIDMYGEGSYFGMTTEPQLWYAVGQHFGCPNLNIGTELEMTYNFTGGYTGKGFMFNPCLGIKWNFL